MYQFVTPLAQQIVVVAADGSAVGRMYSFQNFLAEFVWPSALWRTSPASVNAWYVAQQKLLNVDEGTTVHIDDATWEFFWPIATMQGRDLPNNVPVQLGQLMRPILQAQVVAKEDIPEPA